MSSALYAAPPAVTNCNDGGGGSLRNAIGSPNTHSDDTIDLSGLMCSTITLTTAQINIIQKNLTLQGPVSSTLTLSGNKLSRIFSHTGAGTLTLNHLTLTQGKYKSSAAVGGCVYSNGSVTLNSSIVSNCQAIATSGNAGGGGLYVGDTVTLTDSVVTGNVAKSYKKVYGGGLRASSLISNNSTLSQNKATYYGPRNGYRLDVGGAAFLYRGTSTVQNSTVANNYSYAHGGAFALEASILNLIDSTVSGNSANTGAAAMDASKPTIPQYESTFNLSNSTIAFNSSNTGCGCAIEINSQFASLKMDSTIVTHTLNQGALGADIYVFQGQPLTISGTNNMVSKFTDSTHSAPPSGFITVTADPMLTPLAFHGGSVAVHALLATSPVIGLGVNLKGLLDDERGIGFPRENSSSGTTDIGAYERQFKDDEIYRDDFDGGIED